MAEPKRIPLDDRQHAELLFVAAETLQHMRDTKAEQREVVLSALALIAAALALREKLGISPPTLATGLLATLVLAICLAASYHVVKQQKTLIRLRLRNKSIQDHHFTLQFEPITGEPRAYEGARPPAFSAFGDLVVLYLCLIGIAGALATIWIIVV